MTRMLRPARLLSAAGCALLCLVLGLGYASAQSTPAAPAIDSVTSGDTTLTVAWSAPAGETGITAYDVRHIETSADETDDANWTVEDNAWTSGTLSYTLTRLGNGTQYDVQVRAVNSNGDGIWSATEVGTSALPAPVVDSVRADDRAVRVSWSAPDGITTGVAAYDVRYIETSADEMLDPNWTVEEDAWEEGGGSLAYGVAGLTNGTGYDVQVRAVDEDDVDGAWSATTSATPSDHGDTRAAATSVTADARVWGAIDPADDEDYFSFSVSRTADYWIYTLGDLDTVGELLDSNGMSVESNDYGAVPPDPDNFFLWHRLESGTYYIKVTGFGPTDEPYILRVREIPETTSRSNATTLNLNGSASGTIDPEDDQDYFKLELSQATEVAIRASGFPDTVGELQRSNGTVIASNDDGYLPGGWTNFLIRENLNAGVYYVRVSSFAYSSDGPYTVFATAITEPGSAIADAQPLTLGGAAGGIIDPAGDEDYFSLTLEETTYVIIGGVSEVINISGALTDENDLQAPVDSVHFDDIFTFQGRLEAGTYHLKVTGKDGTETGRYTVRAIEEGGYTYFVDRCSNITTSSGINDPLYGCQWHLNNDGQFRNSAGQDIRVEEVWPTYTGSGINVAVVDDGMHYRHEDLADNVLTSFNHNYDPDLTDIYHPFEDHGTAVAGLIAAKDNSLGMRGVAPGAKIYGYNYLVEESNANEANAMSRNAATTAISNNSWGPGDSGQPEPATELWEAAVKYGVTTGYGGKGVFYAWAAGNGGDDDYSTLDEYSNFYAVTAVCAVGHDDKRSDYSEAGANLWVCGPSSSGRDGQPRIATTDNGHRYRGSFGGTSAATPIVSGVVALIRQANSALTWRDVKLILAASARKNDPDNTGWVEGAFKYGSTTDRYNFNHEYGFGMVDAKAAVDLATTWTNVRDLREITSSSSVINLRIPDLPSSDTPTTVTTSLTIDPFVDFVEFVEVNARFNHSNFRDLTVDLVSPAGAVSTLSPSTPIVGALTTKFRFGSARHLGEDAAGEWTLRIKDALRIDSGSLRSWGLTIYGHGSIPGAPDIDTVTPGGGTLTVGWKAPTDTGETAITSYDLRYIRDDVTDRSEGNWSVETGVGTPSNRSHTITGLEGGTKYEFQLRAHNGSGHGPWSQAEADEPTTTTPSAPAITSLTRGDRTLAVVWTAPVDTGGGVITAYDVRYIETSEDETVDSNWTVRDNAWRSGNLRNVISNLTNATEYDVQVRAVNSAGDGAWSDTETGTPLPDDIPITLQWEETSIEVDEDAGSVVLRAVFTTTLDSPPEADFTFDVILTTTDSGTTQGDDYTTPASSATFVASDFSQTDVNGQQRYRATRDFSVAIIDDTADESDEAFRVRLAYATPGLSHLQGGPSTAVVTIKDNEHVPVTLSWEQPDVTVRENAGSATLRAYAVTTEDKRPEDGFSFDASIRTSDGSAAEPADYTQVDATVTFSRNDFSRVTVNGERRYRAAKQVQVPIQDDTSDEDEEDFTVTIQYANPGPPHLQGGPATTSVKITDNDFVPVTISWDQSFVSVDEHARTVTLRARATTTSDRMPESGFNVALSATTADGTATQGSDYRRLTSRFSLGQGDFTRTDVGGRFRFQATRDISVSLIDDTVDEPDEDFTVILNYSNPSLPHLQGGPDTATVTITDVNAPPTITTTSSSATGLRQPENRTSRLYTYRATDPEGRSITWSVIGTDGRFFTIDERGHFSFSETSPPNFEIPGDSGQDNIYDVTVQARDDQSNTATLSVTVTVTDVNEGPAVTGRNSYTVEENQELSGAGFFATDPEGDSVARWSLSGTDQGDFNISQDGELTFRNTPNYESPSDSNRNNEYLVTVRASDGQYTGMLNVTVTVRDVNEAPVLDGPDTVDDFPENASTSRQVARYTASDPERATVTLSLTGTDSDDFTLASNGVLTFNTSPDYEDQSSYSVTVRAEAGIHTGNSATRKRVTVNLQNVEERGTVTLSAVQPQERTGLTATLDDDDDPTGITWQWYRTSSRGSTGTAITSATFRFYTPVADDVGSYLRAVASYDDGHGTGKTASAVSANRVQAAPPDPEPPVFPVDGNYGRSIRENTRAGANLGAPVRATDGNNDRLTYSIPPSIYFEIDASTGQLRTKAELDHEDEDEYTVTVTATDPGGGTGTVTVTITVTDVNEGPEVSGRNSYTVEENQELSGADFFATDPEGDSVARWSLSGTDQGDFNISQDGELTFRNTPNYESPADSNRNNEYLVTVRASDGQYTGMLNVAVTVRDENEAPEFTSNSKSRTSFTYTENSTHALYTYQAADPEGGTITWSVSGTDGGDFDIGESGALSFANVPDFEAPVDANGDNEYLVTVQARDDGFNFDRLEVTVNVTNSIGTEEPTITTTSRPALTYQENGTRAVYTYSANDPQRGIITWSVTGTDAHAFTITSDSRGRGVLTFTDPPDFENPTDSNSDNVYEITVVATDEQGLTDSFDVTVTVTNHSESVEPTISTRRPPAAYRENGTATVYNFRASDPQRGPITWSRTGTDASAFALSDSGELSFVSPPDFESPSDSDRQNDYELTVVATDEDSHSDRLAFTITVTDVNEGPEITRVGSAPGSVAENHGQTQVLARYTAIDPEDTSAQISRWNTSGRDGGDFVMNEQGELRFRYSPDYERPADSNRDNVYEVTVRAYDGRYYGTFEETITVTPVNETPTITTTSSSATGLRQPENQTSRLYTYRATDPEGSSITWSVGGTDSGFFAIDERGQFSFSENSPPDFEFPGDSGGDNVYNVTVQASDGTHTGSVAVMVNVTDVNEGPTVSGSETLSSTENRSTDQVLSRYTGSDPESPGTPINRWSTSGTDGGDFTINEDGELTFRNVPDYERPADSNRDNIYTFSVRAYDGRYYGYHEVTVTLTDVDEISGPATLDRSENFEGLLATYSAIGRGDLTVVATWRLTGTDSGDFSISEQGELTFRSTPDYEGPADSNRDNVYNLAVQVSDGGYYGSHDVTVTVTPVNEPPTITTTSSSATGLRQPENRISTLYTFRATDPEGGTVAWSAAGPDGGDFTIVGGALRFGTEPDFESPTGANGNEYRVTVRAEDAQGNPDTLEVTVTVTAVDEGPEVTGGGNSFTVQENQEWTGASFTASDPEGGTVARWSLAGRDGGDFAISETGLMTFRNVPDYERPADSNRDNLYEVTVRPYDGRNYGSHEVTVRVTPVNEPPTITTTSKTSLTQPENRISTLYTFRATDPEGGTVAWSAVGPDGGDFTIVGGALRFGTEPDFESPTGANGNEYRVTVRAEDAQGNPDTLEVTVTVTAVDEGPEVTGGGSSFTVQENQEWTGASFRASDPEGGTVSRWRLAGRDGGDFAISDTGLMTFRNIPDYERPADSNRDNLYEVTVQPYDGRNYGSHEVTVRVTPVNEPPSITTTSRASFTQPENRISTLYTFRATDPEGGTVAWSAVGPDGGDFTIVGGALRFGTEPDFESPTGANGNEYQVTVRAEDAQGNPDTLEVTVTVTAVDEGPEVTGGGSSFTVQENQEWTGASFRASDPEGGTVARWRLGGRDGGDFAISETGLMTFRNVPDYERPADSNRDNLYEVTVQPYDGRNYGSHDVTVTVTPVNEAPTITTTGRTSFTQPENRISTLYTFRATDPEGGTVAWSAVGPDGGDFTIVGGALRFGTEPDFESPTGANGNEYQVTVRAEDAQGNPDTLEVTVTVTAVDEGPEVTSGGSSFTVQENQEWTGASFRASDPEGGTVARWRLAGRDGGDFSISETGLMTFRNIPDYERPADSNRDNLYEVTVQPYDGRNYGSHDVTVTVTPVNEAPTITTTGRTSFTQPENRISTLYTFRATDPEGGDFEWDLAGPDAGDFSISETGVLSFSSPPDFESPTGANGNEYQVTVQARDQQSNTSNLPVTVTVTDVNEGPEIRRLGNEPGSVPENQDQMQVLARYSATDPEDTSAQITLWSTSGTDGGDFVINEQGELRFRNSPDHERPADSNRDNVYEVSIRASDGRNYGTFEDTEMVRVTNVNEAPVITTKSRTGFTQRENATSALHTYRATDPDRDDAITWSVEGTDRDDFAIYDGILTFRLLPDHEIPADSNGDNEYEITVVASDSGNLRDTVEAIITITEVNEGPEVSGRQAYTVVEGQELIGATFTAADPEGDAVTRWSLSGSDGGDFEISGTGVLTFRNVPDYDRPTDSNRDNEYLVSIRVYDAGNRYGSLDVTVTVTDVNEEAPVVTGSENRTVSENSTSAIHTYRATDADLDDTIAWSTSGADGHLFEMSVQGALSFREAPDYENPRDSDRNNEYQLEVVATDSEGLTGELMVTITVTEVNEGPEITGTPTYTIQEFHQNLVNATYSATDPEGDSISRWRLSGSDGGDFTITDTSEQTGRNTADLSFRYPPDVDRPADSNRDNEYLVTIRAYDNRGRYGSYDVTVIVTAANEPPVITGSDARTFRENGTGTIYSYRATDPEGDDFSWIPPGGTDGHLFDISDRGALTFRTPPDFDIERDANGDNDYQVTVQARDDSFNTGAFDVTVTVTDVNEGPEVSGRETMTVQEYTDPTQDPGLQTLETYSARDPEGSDISRWSLSGSDGGDFSINERGELTFRYAPDYDRPVDSNRDNEYLVSVRAYDETNRYGSLDVTVTVRGENEADPVVTGSQSLSFRENTAVTTRLYTYRATDTDRDTIIVWSVRGQDGSDFDIDSDDGVLTFKEAPDYEIPADSDTNNEYLVTVAATDGEGREGTLDVVVTVTEVPEGPEITAPSGQTEFTYDENVDRVVATLTARDPEEPASGISRWSLAGSDGGDLTITDTSQQTGRNTAQLTFRNTPDYERPADSNRDNEYLVTIRAYDQGNRYGSLGVKIAVIDENEDAPVVTGSQTLSFRENTATTTRLHTYRARDMDRGAVITWSLEGDDQGDFAIDEGVLTFNEEPDYEDPDDVNDDNEYEITVAASDGTNRGTLDVSIMVTEVNEGPEITGPATRTVAENFEGMVATYTGEDPEDTTADINRWSVTGRDGGDFTINEGGELTFRNPPDFERPADSNRDNEYEVTVRASDGRHYGTYDVTVTVEAVNEAPEFRSGSRTSFTHRENGTSDLYTYRATDPEGDEFTWEAGGTDGGAFEISEDGGVLAFKTPPDFENPGDFDGDNEYLVTVVVRDDRSNMSELEVMVSVTGLNEGPEIQETPANTDISVSENSEGVLFDYSATDPEDPDAEITRWSATGTDGGDFTINEDGELSFRNVPDFERPADSNRDNEYLVTVRASDGRYYGTLEATVRVEAVNERPEFRGGSTATFTYKENGTSDLYTYRATDPEGNDVAWGLSGTDRGAFDISETGVLSFIDPPDYESPTDSGSNNVYELTVEAGDGEGNTAELEVTVTVTNLTDRLPVITGTAQVGRTLRADTSDIAAADGQAKVSYSYQWIRNEGETDTDIDGETDPTYTPSGSDVGKTLKVRVSFSKDAKNAKNQEALTSEATAAVAAADNRAPTGLPTISGTAQVDQTLTADTSGIADEDGLTNVSYSYQWIAGGSDIDGATGSSHTLTTTQQGQTIQVRVSFTDDRNNAETLTSEATGAVAAADNRAATGLPTIGGTAQVEETLTADTTGIADEDGLTNVSYSYQWIRSNGTTDTDLAGEESSTYTLVAADEGKTIKVKVSFADDANNLETLTSGATAAVAARLNSPATGAPAISGTAQVGETLTASTSDFADQDGLDNASFSYQWLADDSAITDATGSTYTLVPGDQGKTIKVRVSFTDDANNLETLTSGATAAVAARLNSPATGAPAISGTAQVGETLMASTSGIADQDGLDNATFSYQWLADDSAIPDATGSTYTLVAADEGKTIEVKVSFTDDANNLETLTSAATAAVAAHPNSPPTGLPTISGTVQVDETLTADTTGIADADGLTNVSFNYQWIRNDGNADTDIQDATSSTYSLVYDDVGRTIKVRVSFTDDASHEETQTSAPTEAVTLLVWSATLTAGTRETHSGYNLLHSTGALSQTEFTLGGDDYTVKMVVEGDDGLLSFGLDRRLRTDFTLNVGGVPFSSEDASTTKTGFVHTYQWDKGTVDWSVGDEVELSLTVMGTPATGQPTINGTVQVGETLTADTSGIADADGLDDAVFSYQWIAGGTDIQDATSSTYTLDADDVGKTIKVRVSFTDNADNEETLTSAATATVAAKPNTAPTGLPIISGRVQVGETLMASTSGIADQDGLDNASFSYQWLADDSAITDATGSTYTLVPADRGKTIKVKVSFADDANNLETLTSAAMAAVAARPNSPPTGLPTISGTVQVGETLTADTSGIADEDGLDNVSYSYQWIAGAADIDGATGSTYALVPVDVGKAIKVKVSFTDDAKNQEALTSAATAAVAAADNRAPTGLPTIRGTVQLDETLTADTSVIADEDGLDDVTYSYQWIAGGSDIDGATGSSHTLTTSQQGQTIQVRVSFTDDRNNAEALTSGATGAVAAAVNRTATGLPTIGGTAQVGETLTASTSGIADQDGLDNASFSYQWLADDSAIPDATGSTYTLVAADQGKTIKVRVSFTDNADNEETLTSAATAAVAARPNSLATGAPTISGTAQVGEPLTADTSGIADGDGLDNVSYSYQWIRSDGSNDTDIEGEKSSTYTLVPADQGKTIKVKVSFTDDANNVETLTSAATAAVAAADNRTATGLPTISGTVQVDQTLTADTSGIADEDGLTSVSYSYQWIRGDGNTDTDISGETASTYTLVSADVGKAIGADHLH